MRTSGRKNFIPTTQTHWQVRGKQARPRTEWKQKGGKQEASFKALNDENSDFLRLEESEILLQRRTNYDSNGSWGYLTASLLASPPSALLAPQLLIPMIISCWRPFTPHLVLPSDCTKWSWQQDSLSYQQHTIIEMPTPARLLFSARISEVDRILVKGEKGPTYLCVNGI